MFHPLIQTLRELLGCHQDLLVNAERKKESIIVGDIETLSMLTKEEGRLVRRLGKLEEERIYQLQTYAESQGIIAEDPTLSQLMQLISDLEVRKQVGEIAEAMQQVIAEIRDINELNAKLIEDALHYVNQSIELMIEPDDDDHFYQDRNSPENSKNISGNRSFFDTKA